MRKPNLFVLVLLVIMLFTISACSHVSGRLFVVPANPSPKLHYLFYLHEANLEDLSPDNKHVKNYEKMVGLWANQGYLVFSEHRDVVIVDTYAKKISAQVQGLIKRGVPASHISVVGYSKGSLISQAVAEQVNNAKVNYVWLAGCSDTYPLNQRNLKGRVLSIIDKNDFEFHSCNQKTYIKKQQGLKFKEITLDSGMGHNLFRVPREKFTKLWQEPLKAWLASAD